MSNADDSTRPDPVLTQVIGSAAAAASEEMGAVLVRTAFSTNIKERADCSTAVFDAAGRTIAQASYVPLHLGSLMGVVGEILAAYPRETLQPGDMFLANDPYHGVGSQLNDVAVAAPVFHQGEVVAFVANIAHHADVGGRFPGSEAAASGSIFEEGVRFPVVRLMRAGELMPDVVRILQANSRVPRNVDGDLRAQMASIRVGVRRLEELHARYGSPVVARHLAAWLDAAESRVRAAIGSLTPGVYRFEDQVDDDGGHGDLDPDDPLTLRVALTVHPDALTFDFSGCPPQATNSHNVVWLALLATVYYATKAALDPQVPPNAGLYRAVTVLAPEGSLVNARPPAAVATRNHTCQKLVDVIMGAFAQAAPDRAIAGCAASKLMIIGGRHPETGAPFIDYEASAGGLGARAGKDGLDVCRAHMTNTGNLPIEALEQEDPLLVERYELVADTGGPGRFRGGLGARRDTRMLGDGFEHSGFATGHEYPGVGLQAGSRGRIAAASMLVRYPAEGGPPEPLHPAAHHRLRIGDVLSVATPGGGGYGDPLTRDPMRVQRDVAEERVTREVAARDYGVVIDSAGAVDAEGTRLRRAALLRSRGDAA
jgi:N-methylhydantoinase B